MKSRCDKSCSRIYRSQGFTLVELTVTMLIAAIVLAVGMPSFRSTSVSNHSTTLSNELLNALVMARNEAIMRGHPVYVCATTNPGSVNPVCSTANGTNWDDGWLVMLDEDNDGDFTDQVENPILVHAAIKKNYSLIGQAAIKNLIGFQATGFATQTGSIVLCNPNVVNFATDKQHARVIVINGSGRSRVFKGDNNAVTVNSCIPA